MREVSVLVSESKTTFAENGVSLTGDALLSLLQVPAFVVVSEGEMKTIRKLHFNGASSPSVSLHSSADVRFFSYLMKTESGGADQYHEVFKALLLKGEKRGVVFATNTVDELMRIVNTGTRSLKILNLLDEERTDYISFKINKA